ncbi:oligopeptide ABC transporter permease [Jiangella gansuensis]|uniref:oligopeptide ABC transporter permease n=1 Tax=Jiangella gansuensis TaxID=281473 RepID=UPI0004BA3E3E|nr:oligopeptide ABC transporter permease [Jiangella gansuensis]
MTAPDPVLTDPPEPVAVATTPGTARLGTRSPRQLAWRRFRRNRLAMAGAFVLVVVAVMAISAPLLSVHDPNAVSLAAYRQPPSGEHWLGTDSAGRDVLARILHGGRVSLAVGLVAALTAVTLGMLVGAVAGLRGGAVDATLMRVTDIVLSFPSLLVVLVVVAMIGPSMGTIILAIGLFEWPTSARIVRAMTLSIREQEFVHASRNFGSTSRHVLFRHVVPSVIPPLTVAGTVLVAQAIMLEAALSFLGLGVPPPQASWGGMLFDAQSLTILKDMPWLWIPPGVAIAVTVMAVNFVGDGLRDAHDPRHRIR